MDPAARPGPLLTGRCTGLTRTYFRLSLSCLCALAAFAGPVHFLEDRARVGYLAGGFAAAFLTWLLLSLVTAAEAHVAPMTQCVLGAGAAAVSWVTISLVAAFTVIPHALKEGMERFDPVWIMGGFSPVFILAAAWWRYRFEQMPGWQALCSALFRFSVPLFGLEVAANLGGLPKQYRWLFLFTGVMFLVLDGLGTGGDLPYSSRREQRPGQ